MSDTDASDTADASEGTDPTDPADAADGPLVVYSDYVCPFCYLGKASLERYRAETDADVDVEWHPFDLRGYKRNPDGSIDHDVEDGKDDDYFDQVRENVQKLQDRYDVDMIPFDDVPDEVDSWNAQLVALHVRRAVGVDAFRRLHEALFEALWQDARDIGDPDVLRDVVESVDLDADLVDDALADADLEADLEAQFDAAQAEGVTGIPTFVYGEYAARGAVPPEQLRRLVEGV